MEDSEDGPVLVVGSSFMADHISQQFDIQMRNAARHCGLPTAPKVRSRTSAVR
jgi:hypothetical protein